MRIRFGFLFAGACPGFTFARRSGPAGTKDKSNAPAKKVFTNEDLPSGSGSNSLGPSGELGQFGQHPRPLVRRALHPTLLPRWTAWNRYWDKVASLDRDTLVKNVLQGNSSDFPGRRAWKRDWSRQGYYVSQGRALLQKARQIESSAENMKGIQNPNDPHVKDLNNRLQQFVQDAV